MVNPNANVREIISYINEMVALKQEWCNEILMINIALFCLKKTDILANPVEQILSGDYLNGIQTIINNDLQTQREIAALVYGVDVEDARQIPLKKYIEGCINGLSTGRTVKAVVVDVEADDNERKCERRKEQMSELQLSFVC